MGKEGKEKKNVNATVDAKGAKATKGAKGSKPAKKATADATKASKASKTTKAAIAAKASKASKTAGAAKADAKAAQAADMKPAGASIEAIANKVGSSTIRSFMYAKRETLTYVYNRQNMKEKNCCLKGCFLEDGPSGVLGGFVVFAGSWTTPDSECDPEMLAERDGLRQANALVDRVLTRDVFFMSSSLAKAVFFGKKGGGNSGVRREIDWMKLTSVSGLARAHYRNVKALGETFVLDQHLPAFMDAWKADWDKHFDRKTILANAKALKAARAAAAANALAKASKPKASKNAKNANGAKPSSKSKAKAGAGSSKPAAAPAAAKKAP